MPDSSKLQPVNRCLVYSSLSCCQTSRWLTLMALVACDKDIRSSFELNDHGGCDPQMTNQSIHSDSSVTINEKRIDRGFAPNLTLPQFDEEIQVSSSEETATPRSNSPMVEDIKQKLYENMNPGLPHEYTHVNELNAPVTNNLVNTAPASTPYPLDKAFDESIPSKILYVSMKNNLRFSTDRSTWLDKTHVYCRAYGSRPKIHLSEISPNRSGLLPRLISYSSSSGKMIVNHTDLSLQPEPLLASDLLSSPAGCDNSILDDEVRRLLEQNETMDTGLGSSNTPLSGVSPISSTSPADYPTSISLPHKLHHQSLVSTADIHLHSDSQLKKKKRNKKNKAKQIIDTIEKRLSLQVNGKSSNDKLDEKADNISASIQEKNRNIMCIEPTEVCTSTTHPTTVPLSTSNDVDISGSVGEKRHVSTVDADIIEHQGGEFTLVVNKKDKRLQKLHQKQRMQYSHQPTKVGRTNLSSSSSCASSTCNGENSKTVIFNGHSHRSGINTSSDRFSTSLSCKTVVSSQINGKYSQRAGLAPLNAANVTGIARRPNAAYSPACRSASNRQQCQLVNNKGNAEPTSQPVVIAVSCNSQSTKTNVNTCQPVNTSGMLKNSPGPFTNQFARANRSQPTSHHALCTFMLSRWTSFLKRSTTKHSN